MVTLWSLWIALILASFCVFEGYAIAKNRTTLSRYVWNLTKAWPPLPLIVGAVIGFVSGHFWWGGALICY